jgi:ElaA protein
MVTEVSVAGFAELDVATAYDVWRLRQDVFVVEQACAYPDLDGRDREPATRHVVLRVDGEVRGYARVLDDGSAWRIGRVLLERSVRGRGLADVVLEAALAETEDRDGRWSARDVVLDAQTPLAGWYAAAGFVPDGPEFVEDGIPHVPMRLSR